MHRYIYCTDYKPIYLCILIDIVYNVFIYVYICIYTEAREWRDLWV